MAAVHPSINDTMTQMQLRLMRQKLAAERERTSRASRTGRAMTPDHDEQAIRLQQAMLRRNELLDKIKTEQTLKEEFRRPQSYAARRREVVHTPRRSESHPQFKGGTSPIQVVEHQYRPIRLDPIDVTKQVVTTPQLVQQPVMMGPAAPEPKVNTKAEMMEMMMLQNAQMHQMMMNQMMVSTLPKPQNSSRTDNGPRKLALDLDDILHLKADRQRDRPPSVHHHHYDPPSNSRTPRQPQQYLQTQAPQHPYYSLPPIVPAAAPPMPVYYPPPRYYPAEMAPLKYPTRDPYAPYPDPYQSHLQHHYERDDYHDPRDRRYRDGDRRSAHRDSYEEDKEKKTTKNTTCQIKVDTYKRKVTSDDEIVTIDEVSRNGPEYHPKEPLKKTISRKLPVYKPKKPAKKFGSLPFPGPWALRKFRHAAYAVWFSKILEKKIRKTVVLPASNKQSNPQNLTEDFLFGIRLKEAVAALHKIYNSPTGKVSLVLKQFMGDSSRDLTLTMVDTGSSTERKDAVEDMGYVLENITYEMTEIMPPSGVLGTHRKAVVFEMMKPGKKYPKGYLWQLEKELLEVDTSNRVVTQGDYESFTLLTGLFIGRALVTTLLLKPVEYGLTVVPPGPRGTRNLKLIASMFMYLLRRCYADPKGKPQPTPYEVIRFVYTDEEMSLALKRVKTSLDYSEKLLRNWGREYVKRLKNVYNTDYVA